jgi:hypothetical protein
MTTSLRLRSAVAMVGFCILIMPTAGCSSRSKDQPSEASKPQTPPLPVATPAAPPPAPRPSGARIADEEKLQNLVQGKTTKAEVQELFGIPQEIVFSPGIETFIYYRDKSAGWFSRTTERVEILTVRFDAKGILKDFEYRYSGQ